MPQVYTGNNSVQTQEKDSHPQATERGLRRNQPCEHFGFGCLDSEIVKKNKFLLLRHLICGTLSWHPWQTHKRGRSSSSISIPSFSL